MKHRCEPRSHPCKHDKFLLEERTIPTDALSLPHKAAHEHGQIEPALKQIDKNVRILVCCLLMSFNGACRLEGFQKASQTPNGDIPINFQATSMSQGP